MKTSSFVVLRRQSIAFKKVSCTYCRINKNVYLCNRKTGKSYTASSLRILQAELSRQLHTRLQDSISLKYPEPLIKVNKFELSPLVKGSVMKEAGWRAVFGEQETGGDEEAAILYNRKE